MSLFDNLFGFPHFGFNPYQHNQHALNMQQAYANTKADAEAKANAYKFWQSQKSDSTTKYDESIIEGEFEVIEDYKQIENK